MSNQTPRQFVREIAKSTGAYYIVHVNDLYIDPKFDRDDTGNLEELAQSIADVGFLEDKQIKVRPRPDLNKLEVLDGRRRTKSSRLAHETKGFDGFVKVVYVSGVETEADVLAETLKSQRESKDFTMAERSKYYKMMINDYGKSAEDVAKLVGKTVQHVYDYLRFTKIETVQQAEVQAMISGGKVSETAALTLIKKGISLKNAPLNKKGKIDVQSATKAATGENKYISPKVFRESLQNAKLLAKKDPKWSPVVEALKVIAENQIWGSSEVTKSTIAEIQGNIKEIGKR